MSDRYPNIPDMSNKSLCLYNADDVLEINMNEYDKISLVPINLNKRRTGGLRENYDQWRSRFDALR